jgi:citrate lyase beta subunit
VRVGLDASGRNGMGETGQQRRAALLRDLDGRLAATDAALARRYPGPAAGRQPVHTVYVPADRFDAGAAAHWGDAGAAALAEHGRDDAELAEVLGMPRELLAEVRPRVAAKLAREPVEDLRVDFEDGYGRRGDDEEDAAATAAGAALGASRGALAFAGLRHKSLEADTRPRAVRTLDLFLEAYLGAGGDPAALIVTCPKVSAPEQVAALVALCGGLEAAHGIASGSLRFELQIETPPAVLGPDGAATTARMLGAADGRCLALVYGTYDYSASLGVSPAEQRSDHPVAEHAKAVMQVAAAGTGVRVSDGSSNILPVGDHAAVLHAWRVQARLVWRALRGGLYQGWDMHPAQLPARFLVTYAFFRQGAPAAAARLRAYRTKAESGVMDEPATERALVAYLARGVGCGALDPDEVEV